jgi:hypothetical protein
MVIQTVHGVKVQDATIVAAHASLGRLLSLGEQF